MYNFMIHAVNLTAWYLPDICTSISGVYAEPTLGSSVEQSISRARYPHFQYDTNFTPEIENTVTSSILKYQQFRITLATAPR